MCCFIRFSSLQWRPKHLAPLRSAIGILEYWNNGIMGNIAKGKAKKLHASEDTMDGFYGRILKVDLSEEKYSVEPVQDEILEKYLGGKGLASYLLV